MEEQTREFPCPHCGKPAAVGSRHFPFCAERCKMVDLGRWMREDYTISEPLPDTDSADESDEVPD